MRKRFATGFSDRRQAGRAVADLLRDLQLADPVVLGIPRGGVPVAAVIADALDAPLDVVVARKVGAPHQPEYAIGAIAEGGDAVIDERSVRALGLSGDHLANLVARARAELDRRVDLYRKGRPMLAVGARSAVVVDDGVATGRTVAVALRAVRSLQPARLVFATPVCAPEAARELGLLADDVVCVLEPSRLMAVGAWYADFSQTSDREVIELLDEAAQHRP